MPINNELTLVRTEKYEQIGFEFLNVYNLYSKDFWARKNSMDQTLLDNIVCSNCYDTNMWFNRNLREEFVLKKVKCIVDAGANIGVASCYFAHLFPEAVIYSFEVESGNYELLKKNTGCYSNIRIFKKAIWNNSNGVYISNRDKIYGHSGKANPAKYEVGETIVEGEEMIESTTLSQFVEDMKIECIDILKIDIQGAEIEAFEDWKLWLPKVRLLFIETHDLFRNGCSKKVFESIAQCDRFIFVGSPNGEILAFIKKEELL